MVNPRIHRNLGNQGWLVRKRWVWEGKMSWVMWVVWNYLPKWTMDFYFTTVFKLSKLRGTAEGKKRV